MKNHIFRRTGQFGLLVLSLAAGCRSLSGTVADGRYTSPDGGFSLVVNAVSDDLSEANISDEIRGHSTIVRFVNEWGEYRRIDATRLSAEALEWLKKTDRAKFMEQYFQQSVWPVLRKEVRDVEVLESKHLPDVQSGALLAILRFPKRSNATADWTDETGRRHWFVRLDAVRAFIWFAEPPYIVAVSAEVPTWTLENEERYIAHERRYMSPPEELLSEPYRRRLREAAVRIAQSIEFSAAP